MTFDVSTYWSGRLAGTDGLRGTGHLAYDEAYNRWLYRHKACALQRALRPAGAAARALDLGSGTGWVVGRLRAAGIETVAGCDISPDAVARLTETFPGPFAVVALGADPLPFDDGGFDLVTAIDVLYHVTDDEAFVRTLHDVARVLRPGGSAVLVDAFGADDAVPAEHVRFRSMERWSAAAADAGLRLEETTPWCRWLSRPRDASLLRLIPDRVRGAVEFGLETLAPRPAHLSCARFVRT